MDSFQFDRLVRSWSAGAPRRAILGGLAASALGLASVGESPAKGKKKPQKVLICLDRQTLSVKKNKQKTYLSQGATRGACATAPAPPSPPATPPVSPPPPGPSCRDGVRNGSETAIDCGGPNCPRCANGQACREGRDCRSGICESGVCGICRRDSDCGPDSDACICARAAGHCVSNLPIEDAPFQNDCNCDAGLTCVPFDAGNRCLPTCGDSTACAGANACLRGAGNSRLCGAFGRCFQSIEGGPTRCGFSVGVCECSSNKECEDAIGASAFCVTFSEDDGDCTCGEGITSFCVGAG